MNPSGSSPPPKKALPACRDDSAASKTKTTQSAVSEETSALAEKSKHEAPDVLEKSHLHHSEQLSDAVDKNVREKNSPNDGEPTARRFTTAEKGKQSAVADIRPQAPVRQSKKERAQRQINPGKEHIFSSRIQPLPSILETLASSSEKEGNASPAQESSTSSTRIAPTSHQSPTKDTAVAPAHSSYPKLNVKDRRMITSWFFSALSQSSLASVVGLSVVSNADLKNLAKKCLTEVL
jgi:hypothetical protein